MMYTELAKTAKSRLLEDDAKFHDQAESVVTLLRSLDIVPTRRAKCNGHWHKLLAAMLVTAHDEQTTVDINTRRKGELIDQGLTTKFILWLDNLVQRKLLVTSNGASKAVGALLLADPLIEKLQ